MYDSSIAVQTELDSESIAIMLDGNPYKEMTISVSFLKDVKVDDTLIQQINKSLLRLLNFAFSVNTKFIDSLLRTPLFP